MTSTATVSVTGILVEPGLDEDPRFVELTANDLTEVRSLLGCERVNYVRVLIPGVTIWSDTEGITKPDAVSNEHVSMVLYPGEIFGRVLITHTLHHGSMVDFTDRQIMALADRGISPLKVMAEGCGPDAQIAHWRIARGRGGREMDLHPWFPGRTAALESATVRHCVGCVVCGEAVEVDPPCDDRRWCSPERPCEGLRTALEWAHRHTGGTAAAVAVRRGGLHD